MDHFVLPFGRSAVLSDTASDVSVSQESPMEVPAAQGAFQPSEATLLLGELGQACCDYRTTVVAHARATLELTAAKRKESDLKDLSDGCKQRLDLVLQNLINYGYTREQSDAIVLAGFMKPEQINTEEWAKSIGEAIGRKIVSEKFK